MATKKKIPKRRDSLKNPDRFRGTEVEDRPVQGNLLDFLEEAKRSGKLEKLNDESSQEWTILGRADWAETRFKEMARWAGLEWSGDFRITNDNPLPSTAFERDLIDAAFVLHASRDSFSRSDFENSACHLMQAGILFERCRARLVSRFSRLGQSPQREIMLRLFDEAYERWRNANQSGVPLGFHALDSHLQGAPKQSEKTRMKWFGEWRKDKKTPS
jgi:hypothetical protein